MVQRGGEGSRGTRAIREIPSSDAEAELKNKLNRPGAGLN